MASTVVHEVALDGYKSTGENNLTLGTAQSYGNEFIQLTIGEAWQGLAITATFDAGGTRTRILVGEDGLFAVPPEATYSAPPKGQYWHIVFTGVADEVQRISDNLPYSITDHAGVDGAESAPTPDIWQQFIATVRGDAENAVSQATRAGDAAASALKSATAAGESALQAQQAEEAAKKAAVGITEKETAAAKSAEQAAASAKAAADNAAQAAKDVEQVISANIENKISEMNQIQQSTATNAATAKKAAEAAGAAQTAAQSSEGEAAKRVAEVRAAQTSAESAAAQAVAAANTAAGYAGAALYSYGFDATGRFTFFVDEGVI